MALRLKVSISGDLGAITDRARTRIAKAATAAMKDAAAEIKSKGRAAIASGGLSTKWQNALRAKVYPQQGVSMKPSAFIYHKIPYAGVFQDGAAISGTPLLWLPIEANLPLQSGGKKWTPHDFANQIGELRSGKLGSKPVLFGLVRVGRSGGVLALPGNRSSRRVGSFARAQQKWVPVFVGVTAISDPKKFDINEVARDVAGKFGELFAKNWEK